MNKLRSSLLITLFALGACRSSSPETAEAPSASLRPPVELAGGLRVAAPAGWEALEPGSSMRAAEYRVAGEGGDASMIVYFFGGGGGSVDDNFERWRGQFEARDGGLPVSEEKQWRTDGGLPVHEMRVEGRYVAEVRPGAEERHDEAGWRMLAAVVVTPEGAYYPKLVGPAETVRANQAAWDAFVGSMSL